MTWSIVARGPAGEFGIAIASRFFAVGMLCPYARSGVGAVASQALVNPHYGPKGLDLLENGFTPSSVIEMLSSEDEGKNHRQVHLIDAKGRIAAHTGYACIDWCGHLAGEGYSVAGNMLTGPEVLQETASSYEKNASLNLVPRKKHCSICLRPIATSLRVRRSLRKQWRRQWRPCVCLLRNCNRGRHLIRTQRAAPE